jgi:hypothetical protein
MAAGTGANDTTRPSQRWHLLTGYYGLLQVLHLLVLGYGLKVYLQTGTFGFPAPPPEAGWTEQAEWFLVGNGVLDALIGIVAIIFVIGYFGKRTWSQALGLVCLTASLCSGGFFIIGTLASGAWRSHPGNYAGLVLVFLPVLLLFGMMIRTAMHKSPAALALV